MKVLIDFTQIPIQKVGVGVYAYETFRRIKQQDHQYYFLIQDDDIELERILQSDYSTLIKVKATVFRIFLLRFILEQLYIPFLCLKNKIEVVHSLHYSFPLMTFGVKKVVTIHDMTFFICPEYHVLIKRYYFRVFICLATKFADRIICVSDSTKKDLLKRFSKNKADIITIPLATDSIQVFTDQEINTVKVSFGINEKYILFIGTLEPRKNISSLIKAYANCKHYEDHKLVIVGKKGWYYKEITETINELNISSRIIFTGFVTIREKYALLANASLFIYISMYEGFGLPVLEALNYGIPTITSNISSLPEVAGNAAILVNPKDIYQISNSIDLILEKRSLRDELIKRAKTQVKAFSWEKTATDTISAYKIQKTN